MRYRPESLALLSDISLGAVHADGVAFSCAHWKAALADSVCVAKYNVLMHCKVASITDCICKRFWGACQQPSV